VIQQMFNVMCATVLSKLMLNDVPHALLPDWAEEKLSSLGVKDTMTIEEIFGCWPVPLYHITFSNYLPSILREGLTGTRPKQERALSEMTGKEPIKGVYLTDDYEGLFEVMGYAWTLHAEEGENIVVLRVDLPRDWKVIPDPEMTTAGEDGRIYGGVVVSLDPIPASMVTVLKEYTVDEVNAMGGALGL